MDKYYVLIFENTHNAIMGEKAFQQCNIPVVVMPTPTYITKSCGISIRVNCDKEQEIKEMIQANKILIKKVFLKEGKEYIEVIWNSIDNIGGK